jgi:hypothetical protein
MGGTVMGGTVMGGMADADWAPNPTVAANVTAEIPVNAAPARTPSFRGVGRVAVIRGMFPDATPLKPVRFAYLERHLQFL